jgi:Spy/CpxP family protein refolding chaperone
MKSRTKLATVGFLMLVILLAFNHIRTSQAESFTPGAGGAKQEIQEARFEGGPGGPGGPGQFRGGHSGRHGRQGRDHDIGLELLTSDFAAEKLGLKEDQVNKLKSLKYENQGKSIDIEADMKKADLKLRELMDQDERDRDMIMSQIDEIGKLRTEQQKLQVSQRLTVEDTLTDEQRNKIREHMQQKMKERHERRMRGRQERQGQHGFRGRGQHGQGRRGHPGFPGGPDGQGFGGSGGPQGPGGPAEESFFPEDAPVPPEMFSWNPEDRFFAGNELPFLPGDKFERSDDDGLGSFDPVVE